VKSPRVLLATAAAAVALTACSSPMQPGAAAIVGDERISSSELSEIVASYKSELSAAQMNFEQLKQQQQLKGSMTQLVLGTLVYAEQLQQAAARRGITVSDGEVDAMISQIVENNRGIPFKTVVLNALVPEREGRELVRATLMQQKLNQQLGGTQEQATELLAKELSAVKVSYHPRYGFDPQKGFGDTGRFGELATPAAAAPPAQ
jgi:peptidyl-prolyl cis-trans isomerase SurA